MEIDSVFLAPSAGEVCPGRSQKGEVGTGNHQDGPVQESGIGGVLHGPVPIANVGDLVQDQSNWLIGRHLRQGLLQVTEEGVMIVNELAAEQYQRLRWTALVEELGHPQLEQGGFPYLPPPAEDVDAWDVPRELINESGVVCQRKPLQMTELRIPLAEEQRCFTVRIVGQKSNVHI